MYTTRAYSPGRLPEWVTMHHETIDHAAVAAMALRHSGHVSVTITGVASDQVNDGRNTSDQTATGRNLR